MNRSITLLLLVMLPLLACCSASATNKASDSDSTAVESQAQEEPQGMLKAFGLKGKVKTLTLTVKVEGGELNFSYAFNLKGNYLGTPDYKGGLTSLESQDEINFCSIFIEKWKWTKIKSSNRWGCDTEYVMTKYDNQNRPIETTVSINDKTAKTNVPITYSGSDSHGNYTMIKFGTDGIRVEDYYVGAAVCHVLNTINVEIEYWPDNATATDEPTELTESIAKDLIKRANRKEASALTHDFKRFLDMEASIPFVRTDLVDFGGDGRDHFYVGTGADCTILSDMDNTYVPQIEVKINSVDMEESGDVASVLFYYSPYYDGKYYEENLTDPQYFYMAICKFENGKWVVDDFGWELVYNNFHYYPGSTYTGDNEFMKNSVDAIKSGALEREIRQKFSRDPKMNQYLKKVSDFKTKFNIK